MLHAYEKEIKELIVDRADVCASRPIKREEIDNCVKQIIKYLRYFNSIQEFDNMVFDFKDFSLVMIPNEFTDFIIPKSVKLVPGMRQSTDVLVRDVSTNSDKLSLSEWNDLIIQWRGFFRKDITGNVTSLATIKVDKTLVDVLDKAFFICEDGKSRSELVRYMDKPFVPIQLESWVVQLYRYDYYNAEPLTVVRDLLSTSLF